MGTYLFGLFLVSPGPTYGQNIPSKAFNHLLRFSHKSNNQFEKNNKSQ
jgi:hypothetical protein